MTATTPARRALVALVASAAVLGTAAVPAIAAPSPSTASASYVDSAAHLGYQKAVAVRVLKGVFERGDTRVVELFVRPDYIQHDPLAADGAEALKKLGVATHQQFPDAQYDVKRVISEGDLVLVHSNLILTPGTLGSAVIDIFRFQGGRIAEHWDVTQSVPASSANGNDMFSTVSLPRTNQPGPRELTSYNTALVQKAFDQLLVQKDLTALDRYWTSDYHQHNPNMADGTAGAKAGLGAWFAAYPQLKVTTKRVIAEGDLVAVYSEYVSVPGQSQAIVDLFRVQNGKIVEHWDVVQDVPATSANDNGMF